MSFIGTKYARNVFAYSALTDLLDLRGLLLRGGHGKRGRGGKKKGRGKREKRRRREEGKGRKRVIPVLPLQAILLLLTLVTVHCNTAIQSNTQGTTKSATSSSKHQDCKHLLNIVRRSALGRICPQIVASVGVDEPDGDTHVAVMTTTNNIRIQLNSSLF